MSNNLKDVYMKSVQGKNIWIIGASSGIGEALARELHTEGANLILSARSEDKLIAINKDLDGKHTVIPIDASDAKGLEKAAKDIGTIDSVVFMAAIYAPHSEKPHALDFVHNMLSVNIGGAFNTVYAVLPTMQKQGFGQIVLCGSVAGYRGLPYGQPYCATKAAIHNYAESLKVELEPNNIDVKVISPGFVKTPLTDKNNFPMPMMIESNEAAKSLVKGLKSKPFEIHFPKKFTFLMKFLHLLPAPLYFKVARQMREKQ